MRYRWGCVAQAHPLETGAAQVLFDELRHRAKVEPNRCGLQTPTLFDEEIL